MIVRRRQTESFTVLANAVVDDLRLSYEALGLLVYLLSRPHDWSIRTEVLRKQRGIGRDRIQRFMRELIEAGYVRRYAKRDPLVGTFRGDEYWVFDSPQASDDQFDGGIEADVQADLFARKTPGPENRPPVKSPEPETPGPGYPQPGEPEPVNRPTYKERKTPRTETTKNESTKPAQARDGEGPSFSDFWREWSPSDPGDSDHPARHEWSKLSPNERSAAVACVGTYKTDCRRQDRKLCFASTYLRDRRWRGFEQRQKADAMKRKNATGLIRRGTKRWAVYRWWLGEQHGQKAVREFDAVFREYRSMEVRLERIGSTEGWEWVDEGTPAYDLWKLAYATKCIPMPPVFEDRYEGEPEGRGSWFPSREPESAGAAA